MAKNDTNFDRMIVEERDRWVKSCGPAGGTFAAFKAHIETLILNDPAWRSAAAEAQAEKWVADFRAVEAGKRLRQPAKLKPIPDGEKLVAAEHATVRDFCYYADQLQKTARTKAAKAKADAAMMATETLLERAGGKLDTPLSAVRDEFWPSRETRQ